MTPVQEFQERLAPLRTMDLHPKIQEVCETFTALDVSLIFNFDRIIKRFEKVFKITFNTSKKAHFDSLPVEWEDDNKVVDGARFKWCYLLLLDAMIYIRKYDSFDLSFRRTFNQQRVLYESILAEVAEQNPKIYDMIIQSKTPFKQAKTTPTLCENFEDLGQLFDSFSSLSLQMPSFPWTSINDLKSQILNEPTSKSKAKFKLITEYLTTHPIIENDQEPEYLKYLLQDLILRAIFIYPTYHENHSKQYSTIRQAIYPQVTSNRRGSKRKILSVIVPPVEEPIEEPKKKLSKIEQAAPIVNRIEGIIERKSHKRSYKPRVKKTTKLNTKNTQIKPLTSVANKKKTTKEILCARDSPVGIDQRRSPIHHRVSTPTLKEEQDHINLFHHETFENNEDLEIINLFNDAFESNFSHFSMKEQSLANANVKKEHISSKCGRKQRLDPTFGIHDNGPFDIMMYEFLESRSLRLFADSFFEPIE